MLIKTKLNKRSYIQKTLTIGGKTHYFKSGYEIAYAYYLEALKKDNQILDWYYEPETFWFEGIKRGTVSYKPDFKVIDKNKKETYYEIKGYMDKKSLTKIKRMAKYYPSVTLQIIDSIWFRKNKFALDILSKVLIVHA